MTKTLHRYLDLHLGGQVGMKIVDVMTEIESLRAEILKRMAEPAPPASTPECGQSERDARLIEGLENHEIIYYGPHRCDLCGDGYIVRGSVEQGFGDIRFDYPNKNDAVIYPNRNWTWHQCVKKTPDDKCGHFTGRSSDGFESHCRKPQGHGGSCNPVHGLTFTRPAPSPAPSEGPKNYDDVALVKLQMSRRLVVCEAVSTPHSYAICSCTEGHHGARLAPTTSADSRPHTLAMEYLNSISNTEEVVERYGNCLISFEEWLHENFVVTERATPSQPDAGTWLTANRARFVTYRECQEYGNHGNLITSGVNHLDEVAMLKAFAADVLASSHSGAEKDGKA